MASATAIPNCSNSAHHAGAQADDGAGNKSVNASSAIRTSYSPTNTSPPRSVISPIYTQAGRSAFSMPGPNSASTSPTTTSWYSAGFASGNSQRVRSPTLSVGGFGQATVPSTSHTRGMSSGQIQRDYFGASETGTTGSQPSRHFRAGSFSSGTSSVSSADLEPVTPRGSAGSLGPTSIDQIKGSTGKTQAAPGARRESWAFSQGPGLSTSASRWTAGLGSLRDRPYPPTAMPAGDQSGSALDTSDGPAQGGMSSLFRKLSFGQSAPRPVPPPAQPRANAPDTNTPRGRSESVPGIEAKDVAAAPTVATSQSNDGRLGRRTTVAGTNASSAGSVPRRKPSPMGERLLMGHFTGH